MEFGAWHLKLRVGILYEYEIRKARVQCLGLRG